MHAEQSLCSSVDTTAFPLTVQGNCISSLRGRVGIRSVPPCIVDTWAGCTYEYRAHQLGCVLSLAGNRDKEVETINSHTSSRLSKMQSIADQRHLAAQVFAPVSGSAEMHARTQNLKNVSGRE
jgi:hypothetical protein